MAEYFVIVLSLAAIGVVVTEALRYLETQFARWRGAS
jgi:NitT/TauT family transport system permease protein